MIPKCKHNSSSSVPPRSIDKRFSYAQWILAVKGVGEFKSICLKKKKICEENPFSQIVLNEVLKLIGG